MFDNLAKLHTVTTGDVEKDKARYKELYDAISGSYSTQHVSLES